MNPLRDLSEEPPSRRQFLGMAIAGAVAGVAFERGLSNPLAVLAQSSLSPDGALEELMEGNRRFVSGHATAHEHDLEIMKQNTVEKQEPFAAVLSCADSRVPVELVFDQTIGHIFVTRIAGNIVTPEIMASLEYGAAVLGTKAIVVIGHAHCGAVKAAIQGKAVPGQISALYPHLRPAVNKAGPDADAVTRANARIQATLLRESSPVLGGLIHEGKLKVAAAYYDIATGKVTLLD